MAPYPQHVSRVGLSQSPLDCEVGIDHHFASGAQAVGSFGRGLKRFGRRGKPLSLSRTGAGQCDSNAPISETGRGIVCLPDSAVNAVMYMPQYWTASSQRALPYLSAIDPPPKWIRAAGSAQAADHRRNEFTVG
jgi:hypothetical protein